MLFCTDTGPRACIAIMELLIYSEINLHGLINEVHTIFCTTFRPDLIDMEMVSQQSNRENLEQAFEIAESLGVTRLLDAEGKTFNHNKSFDLLTISRCQIICIKTLNMKKISSFLIFAGYLLN